MGHLDLSTASGMTLALLPEVMLSAWAFALTLYAGVRHRDAVDQRRAGLIALAGLVATLIVVIWMWAADVRSVGLPFMMALDAFRWATSVVFLLGAILTVLLSFSYVDRERLWAPEYYVLLLLATVGMMFMGSGLDLIVIFLGLELMSVAVYVLAGINRRSPFAAEAALKYFLLGAFASGFFLYGIALIYGATGTTNLTLIDYQLRSLGLGTNLMLLIGAAMLLVGFGFKIAAVPFHMWAPDVYDGAPTPVTAFMAAAVKAAGFAALVRVLLHALSGALPAWQNIVWWLAVLTILVGNLIAIAQRQMKRMLAYSSIAHAGYLLAAVASGNALGAGAFLFYALAYTLMTIGAFAVVAMAGHNGERDLLIDDLTGLARRRPWLAIGTAIFMLSLLGFPGTAGFMGKWFILQSILQAREHALAVVLVAGSVLSAGYYLPVVMVMFMKPPVSETAHEQVAARGAGRLVVAVTAICVLLFGVWPNPALDLARSGGHDLASSPQAPVSSTSGAER
ncbi:MAG: NADH-quinone oxidoreductase subunit N [Gemmatimonadetes bacterium]|nr:NADH-quinone oxidoreductase subunit N [Gemmatimonadota bacterium]